VPFGDTVAIERAIKKFEDSAKKRKKRKGERQPRTFIVVEAVSNRSGKIAPLVDIVKLKEKHDALLVLDESLSFGVLGAHGRGLCELAGVSTKSVDAIVGSLEHAVANVGGFCAGRQGLVEHQRLGGSGYCFSASSPPSSCSAATAVIKELASDTGATERLSKLQANAVALHEALQAALPLAGAPVELLSSPSSYVQFLRWTGKSEEGEARMLEIAERCRASKGVVVQVSSPGVCAAEVAFGERIGAPALPPASIRLCASAEHSKADIALVGATLKEALARP
jgi:serine palmitoyltransferase